MKKLSQAIVLAGAMTAGLASVQSAHAEVSASAAVANNYIFRGLLMGSGTPAVSGSIDYVAGGLYVGAWGTSGDTGLGDEYNVYVGFGGETGDFTYDINYLSYLYPSHTEDSSGVGLFEFAEVTLNLGLAGFGLSVTAPVTGEDYVYTKLAYGYESFGIAVGNNATWNDSNFSYTHVDLSYQYNDNVSFMLSQLVGYDKEVVDGGYSKELLFQVSYSLPISL